MTIILTSAALFVAGLIGITLSVPLQAPAVVLLGLAAIFAAAQVWKSGSLGVRKSWSRKSSTWLLWLCLVSIGYFVVRACLSPVFDLGVEDLMLILPAGLLYLIAGYGVAGKSGARFRQGLAWVVVLLLLMHLGSCLLQRGGGDGYSLSMFLTSASRASDGVVTGMYGYYGSFANFAVISGLLSLSLGVWGRFSYGMRGLFFLLGMVAFGMAVWSQSRSAVISLVAALALFVVLVFVSITKQKEPLRTWARKILTVFSLLALLGGVFVGARVFQARAGSVEGADVAFSSPGRYSAWSMAVEQWADTPIFGGGSRSFSYECFRYWSPNLPTSAANPEFVHNEYLQLLADYGLVGFLSILALFVGHLVVGARRVHKLSEQVGEDGLKRGSNVMALAIAGMCGMTAMAVHIAFDFRTHLLANLLLLVCCAVWILPVAKSRVLKSGGPEVQKSRMGSWCLGLVMMVLGLGAIGLGGQQLWGGLPLIENKMAKEDGAWIPQAVDRSVWIPALEKSIARAPNWRRSQRLGALYSLEAANAELPEEKNHDLDQAKEAYLSSIDRHPYNPIPRINLAAIYESQKKWEQADAMYASASEMAKARERWFRMHSQWAAMHEQWAMHGWKQKKWDDAEKHFVRAEELCVQSRDIGSLSRDKKWVVQYTKLLITHARFSDAQNKFEESQKLFSKARALPNWYWWGRDTKSHFIWSLHAYDHGRYLWYQRKPEEALLLMHQAKKHLQTYQRLLNNDVGQPWHDQMAKIQEVIDFLENTGVGNQPH